MLDLSVSSINCVFPCFNWQQPVRYRHYEVVVGNEWNRSVVVVRHWRPAAGSPQLPLGPVDQSLGAGARSPVALHAAPPGGRRTRTTGRWRLAGDRRRNGASDRLAAESLESGQPFLGDQLLDWCDPRYAKYPEVFAFYKWTFVRHIETLFVSRFSGRSTKFVVIEFIYTAESYFKNEFEGLFIFWLWMGLLTFRS